LEILFLNNIGIKTNRVREKDRENS